MLVFSLLYLALISFQPSSPTFPSFIIDYLAADCIELEIRKIYQRCGLRGCSSHSGRRAKATSLNKQGIPLNTIQRILGHSKPEMTITYIDISENQLADAAYLAL